MPHVLPKKAILWILLTLQAAASATPCWYLISNAPKLKVWVHPSQQGTAKRRIVLIHGLGEHSARHLYTVEALSAAGNEVVRFDLRGSGESEGKPHSLRSFQEYVEDLASVVDWIPKDLPVTLMGHSLGGAIALHYLAESPDGISNLILSAPAYRTGSAISWLDIAIGTIFSRLRPDHRVYSVIRTGRLTRDPEEQQRKLNDPLRRDFLTARQGIESLRAMKQLPKLATKITLPVLLVHGTEDRVILHEGSEEIFSNLRSADKTFLSFSGAVHELHNDLERDRYFRNIVGWVDAH